MKKTISMVMVVAAAALALGTLASLTGCPTATPTASPTATPAAS